jgi:hypothetical protein
MTEAVWPLSWGGIGTDAFLNFNEILKRSHNECTKLVYETVFDY